MSFWIVPRSFAPIETAGAGRGQIKRHDDDRRRVDRHGDGHPFEIDLVEQREHVVDRVDATPSRPTSPAERGLSLSSPISVGRSNAVLKPVWPWSSR